MKQSLLQVGPSGPAGILVACSGGLDSVCLLRLLAEIPEAVGGRLEVAHVDHGLRRDSALDAGFCQGLAGELGLPFHLLRLGPEELLPGPGLQAAARGLRRRFFEDTRRRRGLGAISLGHHADDQVETVIFRLVRGTGPRGLGGMRGWDPPYLRPLLDVRRAELEALACRQGWAHREDPSNHSDRYTRNRLRHKVLPALRSIHPGTDEAVLRLSRLAGEDDAYLTGLAREAFRRAAVPEPEGLRLACPVLAGLAPALRRRVYLAAWEALGGDPGLLEAQHLAALDVLLEPGRAHRRASLPGPVVVAASYGELWFLRPEAMSPRPRELRLVVSPGAHDVRADGIAWTRARPADGPCLGVPRERGRGGLWVRTRRPGDRLGRESGGEVKVKDLLMEARLPRWRRARALVVGDAQGALGVLAPGHVWGGGRGGNGWVWLTGPGRGAEGAHLAGIPPGNGCCASGRCDT
ncbi:MAG: tRNA lysidine(34) synthetase TilS [Deferrisomatales bacterium]|nr:tRNA lysidine(34) synthetase TilS [Deferrisomatales bacterium]